MAVNEEFRAGRGFVYVRGTAPNTVIVSFYPHLKTDPAWPGSIQEAHELDGFPVDAALAGDADAVKAWATAYEPWREAPAFQAPASAKQLAKSDDRFKQALPQMPQNPAP